MPAFVLWVWPVIPSVIRRLRGIIKATVESGFILGASANISAKEPGSNLWDLVHNVYLQGVMAVQLLANIFRS